MWMEVVKCSRAGLPKARNIPAAKPPEQYRAKRTGHPTRPPRSRPLAIVVLKRGEEFPEFLKTIRRTVDPQVTGNSIAKMRRTDRIELLIEINGGADSANSVRTKIERSLGSKAKVRKLEETSPVEIRNLDEKISKEEVLDAVNTFIGRNAARVVSMRKVYTGRRKVAHRRR